MNDKDKEVIKNNKVKKLLKKNADIKTMDHIEKSNININHGKKKYSSKFSSSEVVVLLILTCIISLIMGAILKNKINFTNVSCEQISGIDDPQIKEFVKNYNYILENYYGEIDKDQLMNDAIEGMLSSLNDPYTGFMDETASDRFNKQLEGTYEGLGVEITTTSNENSNKYIYIVNVFKNTPAEKAGLQINDKILSIDNKTLIGEAASTLTDYIKNSTETEFEIKILRENEEKNIKIKREKVVLESVSSKIFDKGNQKIGYIYVSIFAANTYEQFKTTLYELENNKINSLIIDLRGNSGGHLTSVKYMASLFLNKDKIIYQTESKSETVKTYSLGSDEKKYKIVMLVDSNSASASELMAAALKENNVATLIGTTTYGKGTVQELVELSDGSQYKFTTKKWLTPNGNSINKVGVSPDIKIDFDFEKYDTNKTDENDNQLQRAIEELTK